jgi:hypothetical protein
MIWESGFLDGEIALVRVYQLPPGDFERGLSEIG